MRFGGWELSCIRDGHCHTPRTPNHSSQPRMSAFGCVPRWLLA